MSIESPTPDEIKDQLELALRAALPGRVVSRDILPFEQRDQDDLFAGVLSFAGLGESDFANTVGRPAQQGKLRLIIVGQLQVREGKTPTPRDVEKAEDLFLEEIKQFFISPPPAFLGALTLLRYQTSGQREYPFGWFGIDAEVLT